MLKCDVVFHDARFSMQDFICSGLVLVTRTSQSRIRANHFQVTQQRQKMQATSHQSKTKEKKRLDAPRETVTIFPNPCMYFRLARGVEKIHNSFLEFAVGRKQVLSIEPACDAEAVARCQEALHMKGGTRPQRPGGFLVGTSTTPTTPQHVFTSLHSHCCAENVRDISGPGLVDFLYGDPRGGRRSTGQSCEVGSLARISLGEHCRGRGVVLHGASRRNCPAGCSVHL